MPDQTITTGDPVRDALAAGAEAVRDANRSRWAIEQPSDLADRAAALADLLSRAAVAAHDLGTATRDLNGWRLRSDDETTPADHVDAAFAALNTLHETAMHAHWAADRAHSALSHLAEARPE